MSETQSPSTPPSGPEAPAAGFSPAPRAGDGLRPRRRRRFSTFLAIAALVLLAGAVALTAQRLRVANAFREDLAAMKSSIETLNARVATLEQSSSQDQAAATQLADLATRLGALESDVAHAADRDTLAQLQDRIARLESRAPSEMLKTAAATLARAILARAAEGNAPFGAELEALRAVDPDDPALGPLQAGAKDGIPARVTLAARFPEAARAALEAERSGTANGNFVSRLWASMRRLISIRRVGDFEGSSTEDRLARAQADLDRGDLARASMEVSGVNGGAAAALAPWLTAAEARIAVDRTIADMNARIVETLAAPPPPAEQRP